MSEAHGVPFLAQPDSRGREDVLREVLAVFQSARFLDDDTEKRIARVVVRVTFSGRSANPLARLRFPDDHRFSNASSRSDSHFSSGRWVSSLNRIS